MCTGTTKARMGRSQNELEMTESDGNVELCGSSGPYYAMTGNLNVVLLIGK